MASTDMATRERNSLRRLLNCLQAWRRNSDGVAAIEFAFIAPVMLIMMFGVFEIARAYAAHRRFSQATYMIGDLITREEKISSTDLEGIYQLLNPVMGSYASTTLKVEVVPLFTKAANPGNPLTYATPKKWNGTGPVATATARCSAYTLTPSQKDILKDSPAGLVLVKAEYTYKPIFNYPIITNAISAAAWKYETTFSPRQSCVAFDAFSCVNICP